MGEVLKILAALVLYGVLGPCLGLLARDRSGLRRWILGALVFLLGLHIDHTTFMIGSIEDYRGVVKGFEITLMETLAIALIASRVGQGGFRIWIPGTGLWLLYLAGQMLSLGSAVETSYVFMALFRFAKAWWIAWGVALALRRPADLRALVIALALTLLFQSGIAARDKWVDHVYQVRGLFEHQNPLAMFAYMAALPLLAVALCRRASPALTRWALAGFGAGAFLVLVTLSRGALAFFAAGVIGVMFLAIPHSRPKRWFAMAGLFAVGGGLALALVLPTILSRFADEGNQASGETREVMNLAALAMVRAQPMGIGWNGFGKAINAPYPYGDVIDDWNRDRGMPVDEDYAKGVAESWYYLHLGEGGWPGLATLLLLVAGILFRSFRLGWRHRGQIGGALCTGFCVAMGVTAAHSTLERVLTQSKNLGLWMVFLGVLAAMERGGNRLFADKIGRKGL